LDQFSPGPSHHSAQERRKVGRNDEYPCGSGKKLKVSYGNAAWTEHRSLN
jgi:hypothetical protein